MDDKHLEDDEKSAVDDFHDVLDKQRNGIGEEENIQENSVILTRHLAQDALQAVEAAK